MIRRIVVALVMISILVLSVAATLFVLNSGNDPNDPISIRILTPDRTNDASIEGGAVKISDIMDQNGIDHSSTRMFAYCEGGRIEEVSGGSLLSASEGGYGYNGSALIGIATVPGISIPLLSGVRGLALAGLNLSAPPPGIALPRTDRVVLVELDAFGWSPMRMAASRIPLSNITGLFNATYCLSAYPPITNVGTAFAMTGAPPNENGIALRTDHTLKRKTILQTASEAGLNASWIESDIGFLDAEMDLIDDSDHDGTSDDEIAKRTVERIRAGDDMILAHFHSYDDAAHDVGPDGSEAMAALRVIDGYVGAISEAIVESNTSTLLIIFSDHGAHPTDEGGGHGEFRYEDMYSLLSWKTLGTDGSDPPALSILLDGDTMSEPTMSDLRSMEMSEGTYSLRSSRSNMTNVYEGVPLQDLIALTGIDGPPASIKMISSDGYSTSIDASWAMDRDVIVAYSKDGAPMLDEGPLRLIVPQDLAGEFNAQYCIKFLVGIEVRS